MDQERNALDQFGRLLIERVRDKAILDADKTLDGRMKGDSAERARERFRSFTPEQREVVARLIADVVDTTLHHLLWTLEQRSDTVQVSMHTDFGTVTNLAEQSDSFPGELYDIDGWIARFSKERHFDPVSD